MTRLLVTRPAPQAAELAVLLAERGLDSVAIPTVAIEPLGRSALSSALDAALARGAEWLVVTSVNGAQALGGAALPRETRVAAVGPATARALREHGIRVDHVPDRYLTVAIADGLGPLDGRRVLLARTDAATPALREALVARGAQVEEVVTYRTIEGPAPSRDPLRAALAAGVAGITFTSASTVRGLLALCDATAQRRAEEAPAFCIGPVTAEAASAAGLHVAAIASDHTARGLADTVARHLVEAAS